MSFAAGQIPTATELNNAARTIEAGTGLVDITPGTSFVPPWGGTAYRGTLSITLTKTFTNPVITVTAHTSVPATVIEVSINNPTTTSFDIVIARSTQNDTTVHWVVQEAG